MSGLGRILIVDDEPSVREVVADYFTEQGYDVSLAASGIDALRGLAESRPDLVLLDVRMPGLDGVETLRRLRQAAPDIAVIMVTANDDAALARDTLELGALDYVSKPFDFAYLEQSVIAGLAHAGPHPASRPAPAERDPWRALLHTAFRVARTMPAVARTSTGTRLEDAALRAAREAAVARFDAAATALLELDLMVAVAAELRDVTGTDLVALHGAVRAVRERLSA